MCNGNDHTYDIIIFFLSSRRRHTSWNCDWSSDVCSSDLGPRPRALRDLDVRRRPQDRARARAQGVRERSEERRVGKEWRSWRSPSRYTPKQLGTILLTEHWQWWMGIGTGPSSAIFVHLGV